MEIEPAAAAARYRLHGKDYYFCRQGCKEKFAANPEAYLSAAPDAIPVQLDVKSEASFTCPMHPAVIKKGPGTCPLCGMALEPVTPTLEPLQDNIELKLMQSRLVVASCFSVPLLFLAMSGMLLPNMPLEHRLLNWIQLALASPVVLWCGAPIFERALDSLKARTPNMFTLIGIGTGIAYAFSSACTAFPRLLPPALLVHGFAPVYFETAAVIITLVLLGQVLEIRARNKAGSAIRDLLCLSPLVARKIIQEGQEVDLPVAEVQVGDNLRVCPGDKVPVDGTIIDGSALIDQAFLTGEAKPIQKVIGDVVSAGTINLVESFIMRADRVGDQTVLAQIVKMVAEAQRTQAPIQHLADKTASYFVPTVIIIAGLTFAAWLVLGPKPSFLFALINAISVLIVACPCALGLATPMSIVVAAGRGARAGVLIKNASALEAAEQIDVLALDKTGTLTVGRPEITELIACDNTEQMDLLAVAAALELHSSHPIARAILRRCSQLGIEARPATDLVLTNGRGLEGRIANVAVAIGSQRFIQELGIETDSTAVAVNKANDIADSAVFVAKGHKLIGIIIVADPIKESSRPALDELRKKGIDTIMLTGDNRKSALKVGALLSFGEKDIFAELLPAEKANVVEALKSSGKRVAMVGDGINDSVALARADVGIAMGHGADVAVESAGFTLLNDDLRGMIRTLNLSRATMDNIRQNLFFAFIYNALGIIIATGIFYPWFGLLLSPMVAATAMSLSSLCVIGNALRLRSLKLV